MPFDSNGVYSLPSGFLAVTGQTILASQHNPPLQDIQAALSQLILRSGVAPFSGNQSMAGFRITNAANGSADGDYVTMSQLNAVIASIALAAVPTGTVAGFRMTSAPAGWVKENGGTIGNVASGATTRASADTEALFTHLWNNFNQTTLPIQSSSGAVTTRGVSAAADYAAAKRMPLFDARSRFPRGADDGLGYDVTLVAGLAQADELKSHTHTASGDTTHPHSVRGVNPGGGGSTGVVSGSFTGFTDAVSPNSVPLPTIQPFGGSETRPRALVELRCIKL